MGRRLADREHDEHTPLVVVPWTGAADGPGTGDRLADLAGTGADVVEVTDEATADAVCRAGAGDPACADLMVATTAELDRSGLAAHRSDDPADLAVAAVDGARLLRTADPVAAARVAGALGAVFRSRAAQGLAMPARGQRGG